MKTPGIYQEPPVEVPMISREQAVELVTEYYESTLPAAVRRSIEERVRACEVTAAIFQSYEKTVLLCRATLKERGAPPGLGERLMGFLRENGASKKF